MKKTASNKGMQATAYSLCSWRRFDFQLRLMPGGRSDYFNDREEEECQNEKFPHEFQS